MARKGQIREKDLLGALEPAEMTLQQRHQWLIRWCWMAREELEAGQQWTRVEELLAWAHEQYGTYSYT